MPKQNSNAKKNNIFPGAFHPNRKVEIKPKCKKTEGNIFSQGMNGAFHSNGGDADRALNHLDPGMLRFLAHFPSYFVWKYICVMMYFYYLPNSTKISTNGEKAMLSWLDIHMVLIPINPKGRSPAPFPPTFAHFCETYRSAYCKLYFENCATTTSFLRDQSPSPIFTRDTFR